MHVITGTHNDSVGYLLKGYFCQNTGYPITGPYSALGWVHKEKIVGQCIFTDFTGANVEIHLYAPRIFNRKTIGDVYRYVFDQLKCVRLTAKPHCTNEKLLCLLERIGFVYEYTQEQYYKEGDEIIDAKVYKLTKATIPDWVKLNG